MNHVYDEWRCIFCGVNSLDADLYGPEKCNDREPMVYTTESDGYES